MAGGLVGESVGVLEGSGVLVGTAVFVELGTAVGLTAGGFVGGLVGTAGTGVACGRGVMFETCFVGLATTCGVEDVEDGLKVGVLVGVVGVLVGITALNGVVVPVVTGVLVGGAGDCVAGGSKLGSLAWAVIS